MDENTTTQQWSMGFVFLEAFFFCYYYYFFFRHWLPQITAISYKIFGFSKIPASGFLFKSYDFNKNLIHSYYNLKIPRQTKV